MNVDIDGEWVNASVGVHAAEGGTLIVNLRCRCGRRCKYTEDSHGYYCRKHGLQGYVTTVNGKDIK